MCRQKGIFRLSEYDSAKKDPALFRMQGLHVSGCYLILFISIRVSKGGEFG